MPFPICVPSPSSTGAGDGLGRERLAAAAAGPRTRPHFRARERGAVASRRVASRRCAVPRTPLSRPDGRTGQGNAGPPWQPRRSISPHLPVSECAGRGNGRGRGGRIRDYSNEIGIRCQEGLRSPAGSAQLHDAVQVALERSNGLGAVGRLRDGGAVLVWEKAAARGELGPQLTAFFTSAPILASLSAVISVSAKEAGHIVPSSRFALSLKPNVA